MFSFLKKLFPQKEKPVPQPAQTAPLSEEAILLVSTEPERVFPEQFSYATSQSVGQQRDHNEDALFAFSSVLAENNDAVPFGIFIVADGMGGHQHGELASGSATRAVAQLLIEQLCKPIYSIEKGSPDRSIQEIVEEGVMLAQQTVLRKAPGGGTTLTVAVVLGEQITIGHVGDSRAYFVHPDGRLQVLTQDHSLVRRLQELGQLSEEEANNHPQRNVLYRAIGQNEPFRPDIRTAPLPKGGYLLLCSDGLWGVVQEDDIFDLIKTSRSLRSACAALTNAANAAGGPDNISAILVQFT